MHAVTDAKWGKQMKATFALLLLCASGLLEANAVLAQVLPDTVQACRSEPDSVLRLQCYDREVAKYPMTTSQSFGLSASQTRAAQQRISGAAPGTTAPGTAPKVQKLRAKVTAIRMRPRGVFVAVLDNGQEWEQNEPEGADHVAVGATVTIEPGLLGSFFMVVQSSRWSSKVHRLK